MNLNRPIKIGLIYLVTIISLTVIWNIALKFVIIPKYFVKTEVKVVEIRRDEPLTRRGGRQVKYLPTYEYRDDKGRVRTTESQDGYNVINGFLLKKEIGQTIKAYYEKDSENGLLVTQTGDWYTFILAPVIFGILPFGPLVGVVIYYVYAKDNRLVH